MNKNERLLSKKEFKNDFIGESYTRMLHSSGLNIYVFPKKLTSTYAIFGTRYGSVNNSFKLKNETDFTAVPDGIAHFLEHKLFTNEDGSDSFERFSEYGADANAYTSFNKTAYLFSCTEKFENSLGELIDFVTHPYFTEESVKSEIGIISEEIKMYDDNPSDRCFYGMLEAMYKHHSIKRNICGTVKTISQISAKTLYRCYDLFYRLSNMALIVCGNVSPEEVLEIADKHLPASEKLIEVINENENLLEPRQVSKPRNDQKMQVAKPLFNIGFKDIDIPSSPIERLRKDAAMSILDEMIFSRAGCLYNKLLYGNMISPYLSYGYTITETFAYNSVAGEADNPDAVLGEIRAYINELKETGLNAEDFERGKRVMFAEFVKNFDSTDNIANTLFSFICESADESFLDYADIVKSIDLDYVTTLFNTCFNDDLVTISIVRPLE